MINTPVQNMNDGAPILHVTGLRTQFGTNVIHDNLELAVRPGEIMGIVGGSGSGKSVLLRTVLGLNRPTAARTGDVETLISDASTTMTNLREASAAMAGIADHAKTALTQIGDAAGTVADNRENIEGLIKDLRTTSDAFTAMSEQMTALVEENRLPLREFTGEGLSELANFMSEARALMDSLTRVSSQVERDPARFLFGNQQQGYETPN